jgi:predicted ABC-type ATPase
MIYLRLNVPSLAVKRVAARVRQGGHDVPHADIVRTFDRSWINFVALYRPLADAWAVVDNSGTVPRLLEQWP